MSDAVLGSAAREGVAPVARRMPAVVGWLAGGVLVALLGALLVTVAYLFRPHLALTIGDETMDKGVVHGFYADERREGDGLRFRWTRGSGTVDLRGWGTGAYQLTLTMAGPLNPEPLATVLVNDVVLGSVRLAGDFRPYTFTVPEVVTRQGDIAVTLLSPSFTPPADRRRLGIAVHQLELAPQAGNWRSPPASALGPSVALALIAYGVLGVAGWSWRAAGIGAAGVSVGLAGLLAGNRLLVSPVLAELVRVGLIVALVGGALQVGFWLVARWTTYSLPLAERRWLSTIMAAALFVRLIATEHPQMDIIDIGFHVNRFSDVVDRGMIFLKIRSAEWGGRETVYSPAAYVAMAPLQWVIADKHTLIRIFTALMETSRALLVFALARWVTQRGSAALLATVLFVSLPLAVLPFSWGITSNLFGEWWATLLLLVLTVWWQRLGRAVPIVVASLVAAMALLAHPGDLLLTGASLGLLGLGMLAAVVWQRASSRATWTRLAAIIAIGLIASGLAFGLLYRVDAATMLAQGGATLSARVAGTETADAPRRWRVSGSVDDKSLGMGAQYVTELRRVPLAGALGFAREAWAYYWVWPLPTAVVGWWLLRTTPRGRDFRAVSSAWIGAAALFAVVGLLLNLYVRYMLFLLPVVAVLSGVALDRLSQWSLWGKLATAALVGATIVAGLWLWHQRVVYFFH